jgi:uncharacterized membrane protein YqaE (UPF0057 family)
VACPDRQEAAKTLTRDPALESNRLPLKVITVAVLLTGRIASFFLSLILTLLGWIPGVIHACLVVNDYHAERRAAAIAH